MSETLDQFALKAVQCENDYATIGLSKEKEDKQIWITKIWHQKY